MPSEGTEGTSMTVHRSWLFVPGDDERKLARAGTSGADALIFDLEDAVVPARRDAARGLVADVLASPAEGGERWVRINPLDSPDALDDLRSEEHTSELQSLMHPPYAVFCSIKKLKRTIANVTT